jgi:acyl-CoA thioesterase
MSLPESQLLPVYHAGLNDLQKQLLDDTPYAHFLGLAISRSDEGSVCYQLHFREQHIGNPLLRTFHGGILASFGEIVAALHVLESVDLEQEPSCSSMTFDYLRPAFAGTIRAVPRIVREGKRFIVVSVGIFLNETSVSIGRFIYTR